MQASNMFFSGVSRISMTVGFTRGDGENFVLLASQYSIPDNLDLSNITDGDGSYVNAPSIGSVKVIKIGDGSSVPVTDLTRYRLYYFKVCEIINGVVDQSNGTNKKSRWTLR